MELNELKSEIQSDLDAGQYGMICSSEDTFKNYVFPKLDKAREGGRKSFIPEHLKQEEIGRFVADAIKNEAKQELIEEIRNRLPGEGKKSPNALDEYADRWFSGYNAYRSEIINILDTI